MNISHLLLTQISSLPHRWNWQSRKNPDHSPGDLGGGHWKSSSPQVALINWWDRDDSALLLLVQAGVLGGTLGGGGGGDTHGLSWCVCASGASGQPGST